MFHGIKAASCAVVVSVVSGALHPAPLGAQAKSGELGKRIKVALDKARPILRHRLKRAHNGELALLCLAALHDELPVDDKVFAKALRRLRKGNFGRTYDIALRLMVMSECPAAAWSSRKDDAAREGRVLLRHMVRGGAMGYSRKDRGWDLSNTQYGVLGLRAAVSLGAKVESKQWIGILKSSLTAQADDGGFGYTVHRKPTASMTVAGIAVLKICADHLDTKTVASLGIQKHLDRAWQWVADHKGEIGDRKTPNSFYFHYGIERASILCDVEKIDHKDWYTSGAEMFLRTQRRVGGWHSKPDMVQGKGEDGCDSVSTSFAILFLRRKFQKVLVPNNPVTLGRGAPISMLGPQATARQIKAAIDGAVHRGQTALPDILKALRSEQKVRRTAAAKALFRIAGKDFGFNPHVAPAKSRDAVKRAERWYLESRSRKAPGKTPGRSGADKRDG